MTNVLLTDLGLSILPKFLFENLIDKCDSSSVDSTIYWQYTYETFHLSLLFELLPSSDPGHTKFWKRETGSMFSLPKTVERCPQHMSAWSPRNTLAFRSDYVWLSNCLQTSNSIALKCCIKTCEYFILTIKENNWNLERNYSYGITFLFHWYLGIPVGKLCPGVGILFRFFDPGAGILHWKAVPGTEILTEKISGPGGDGNLSNWYLHNTAVCARKD